MYEFMREMKRELEKEVTSFAQRLVKIPGHSLHEKNVAQAVEREMGKIKFDQVFSDDYGNVVGVIYGREHAPTVLLNSHLDTVNVRGDGDGSPGRGEIVSDKLYGEGAADCKGGIAAQVYAAELLNRSFLPLRGNLVVALTVAEENGCSVGLRGLMKATLPGLGLKPEFAILGETTGLGVYYGHDGWMDVDISVAGDDRFRVGDCAQAIFADVREHTDLSSRWCEYEDLAVSRPQFQNGGKGYRGTVLLSERLRPGEAPEPILHEIEACADRSVRGIDSLKIAVDVHTEQQQLWNGKITTVKRIAPAWKTDPFNPRLQCAVGLLRPAGCDFRPGLWKLNRLGMGTAGSVLNHEFHVPTIGYGPGNEEQAHRPGEWVSVNNIIEAMYGTAVMVHSLIGVTVLSWQL